jgi:hypothetical protein
MAIETVDEPEVVLACRSPRSSRSSNILQLAPPAEIYNREQNDDANAVRCTVIVCPTGREKVLITG